MLPVLEFRNIGFLVTVVAKCYLYRVLFSVKSKKTWITYTKIHY